jgi:hypothetical protein
MATLRNRLNAAFKGLMTGIAGRTTQSGVDSEWHESSLVDILSIDNSRKSKYKDYIMMDDNYGQIISSSLDAVADCTVRMDEPIDNPIKVMSESEQTAMFVKDLYSFLDIRNQLWTWSRSLSKFGDLFVEIIWALDGRNEKLSHIVGLKPLPASTIMLNINDKGIINQDAPYKQEIDGVKVTEFKPWQLIHFMLRREPSDDYGTSWLKSARIPYRQLTAMENSLVVARLKKVSMRVHKVDITGKTIDQVSDTINEYKKQFKERPWMNPNSGKIEKHKTPVFGNSDIFMGVTKEGGKDAGIDLIEGKSEIDIDDILYIRENLLAALKVPKHRLNINDIGGSNKLVSSDQGLNFSASVQRVQLSLVEGLSFVTDLALIVRGINIKSRSKDYTIALPKQRTVDELIAARVELIKSTVAKNYKEMELLSDEYILSDIMRLEPDRAAKVMKQVEKARKEREERERQNAINNPNQDDPNKNGDDKNKTGAEKDKNFNKTGKGSAPVRRPQKEHIKRALADPEVQDIVKNVNELMRNQRVYDNKRFNMDFIEKQILK